MGLILLMVCRAALLDLLKVWYVLRHLRKTYEKEDDGSEDVVLGVV